MLWRPICSKSFLKETTARLEKLNSCMCASRGIILHRFGPGCLRARAVKVWKAEEKRIIRTRHATQPYLLLAGSPEALASGCYWVFDVSMETLGVYWKTDGTLEPVLPFCVTSPFFFIYLFYWWHYIFSFFQMFWLQSGISFIVFYSNSFFPKIIVFQLFLLVFNNDFTQYLR